MSLSETSVIVVITLWFAVVGACFGSLLNVLVYRWPRGLSIVHPPSSCPRCGQRIAWYDNVPVVGLLWLRGRCRSCRAPISRRYPFVEALVTLQWTVVFLILLSAQQHQTGAAGIDAVRAVFELQSPVLLHQAIGQLALLYWLTGSVLMLCDHQPLPRKWVVSGVVALLAWILIACWL